MRVLFLRNVAKSLSFIDVGKSCPSPKFLMWQICLSPLFPKIKFLQKVSEFTVSLEGRISKD